MSRGRDGARMAWDFNRLIREFGSSQYISKAGFILPDGRLIDVGDRQHFRLAQTLKDDWRSMGKFVYKHRLVRLRRQFVLGDEINMVSMPPIITQWQARALSRYNGTVTYDIVGSDGNSLREGDMRNWIELFRSGKVKII